MGSTVALDDVNSTVELHNLCLNAHMRFEEENMGFDSTDCCEYFDASGEPLKDEDLPKSLEDLRIKDRSTIYFRVRRSAQDEEGRQERRAIQESIRSKNRGPERGFSGTALASFSSMGGPGAAAVGAAREGTSAAGGGSAAGSVPGDEDDPVVINVDEEDNEQSGTGGGRPKRQRRTPLERKEKIERLEGTMNSMGITHHSKQALGQALDAAEGDFEKAVSMLACPDGS